MSRASHIPTSRNPALAAALLAALAGFAPGSPATSDAHAGTVQRCAAPDGTTLYTDRPCASFDATPLVRPGESSHVVASTDGGTLRQASVGHAVRPHVSARRSAAAGCARTPTQLAMDLQGAFALGDVNRIAESWHWVGLDQAAALPVMQRLERLAMSTVVDARHYDASFGSGFTNWADASAAAAMPSGGIMQLTLGGEGGHQVLDLQVEAYEGCYFVRF